MDYYILAFCLCSNDEELEQLIIMIIVVWVPGHVGVLENEEMDRLTSLFFVGSELAIGKSF